MQDKHELEVLKKYFGYDSFRAGQEELIGAVLSGRDALGIMPTGAGKSICYQVPALIMPGITLVISPLISLMKDQVQALNQAGVHAAYINSSLTETQIIKALQLASQGQYKIIYVAPERLGTAAFLEFARSVVISMVTVDEAHCISQWGQDFRPSYLNITEFIRHLEGRPVVSAFTATATERVKEDISCILDLNDPKVLVTGFDRSNLYFGIEKPKKKEDYVLKYISEHSKDCGIIYCATRKNVDNLYALLMENNIPATRYHAGLSAEERHVNQEDFIYDRRPVMVATNAFGMGIDKSNVRYVLHYNMPQSIENYYQEAGRAGRDGEPSECILLYSAQDVMINRFLIDNKTPNPGMSAEDREIVRKQDEQRLRTMSYYCQTPNCLREYMLKYFGEYTGAYCGNCSSCKGDFEEREVLEEAKQVIYCVHESKARYGINVIAGTLAGSDRAKIREYQMDTYETYGALKKLPETEIKQIIQLMLIEGYLEATSDKYALLKLTEKSKLLFREGASLIFKRSKKAAAKTASKSSSVRRSDILNSRGLELFDELRQLRMKLAKSAGVPPYLIFSDKTLVDMCRRIPLTEEEMLEVNGVGQNKLERFGEDFIDVIYKFTGGVKEKTYY